MSGLIADRLLAGDSLAAFSAPVLVAVAIMLALLLVPLLRFTPYLRLCKRQGLLEYGEVAMRCMTEFDRKWGANGTAEHRLLGGKWGCVVSHRHGEQPSDHSRHAGSALRRAGRHRLVLLFLLPLLPLTLTLFSLREILQGALRVLF